MAPRTPKPYIRAEQRPEVTGAALRSAQRIAGSVEDLARRAAAPLRRNTFPYRPPTVPATVEVVPPESRLGADYDTEWARSPLARAARGLIVAGPLRAAVQGVASPTITGTDRLVDLMRLEEPPSVIFAPNHHSHVDTGLIIHAIPSCWRTELVVAAAADYFFDARWKATMSALALNAVPVDRDATSRATADRLRDLLADGNSLIIYPEGGRSPDGWGQEFKGGAAYLSARTGAPVIPVFIDGTGEIYGKGAKRLRPGRTSVVFGTPLVQHDDENTRRFNSRIQAAVTRLGDEVLTDFWTAGRNAARGLNPSLAGPDHTGWRRQWQLGEHRKRGTAGLRLRRSRSWPDLG